MTRRENEIRENQMRERIHDVEEMLVKAAIMVTEAREERDEFRRLLDKGPAASVEAQAEINHWRERAEAAEKALQEIATECSTFPIKNGLAFRCESIARAALGAKS